MRDQRVGVSSDTAGRGNNWACQRGDGLLSCAPHSGQVHQWVADKHRQNDKSFAVVQPSCQRGKVILPLPASVQQSLQDRMLPLRAHGAVACAAHSSSHSSVHRLHCRHFNLNTPDAAGLAAQRRELEVRVHVLRGRQHQRPHAQQRLPHLRG